MIIRRAKLNSIVFDMAILGFSCPRSFCPSRPTLQAMKLLLLAAAIALGCDATKTQLRGGPAKPQCTVAGKTFSGTGVYITGTYLRRGSIYADCLSANKPECFLDEGILDKPDRKSTPCASVSISPIKRELGVAPDSAVMWPKGVVCYEYATQARRKHGELMGEAMDMYASDVPGVQFIHRSECVPGKGVCNNCQSIVRFYHNRIPQGQTVDPTTNKLGGCYSSVGFDSSLELNLEDRKCDEIYHYVHELGHVLGLGHEHSHSKRGVIALRQGVPAHLLYNLRKDAPGRRDTAYDRLSIMHYSKPHLLCWPRADPPNQPPTVWCDVHQDETNGCRVPTSADCAKVQPQISGQKLSPGDIALLNSLYPANAAHNAAVAEIPPTPVAPLPSSPDAMLHSQASLTRAVRRPNQPSKQAAKPVKK